MTHQSLIGGLVALAVFGAGCVDRVPLDETPCPCAPGWVCDKSGGEPGVCVKKTVDGGNPEQTPWYQQDAALGDAKVALGFVGTWKGYVENHTFDSGSDVVELVLSPGAQPGTLSGYVIFGKGEPPAVDPDLGFPADGQYQNFLQEGFRFQVMEVVIDGARIRFKVAHREQWKEWCEAQTSYQDPNNPDVFRCLPNLPIKHTSDGCYFFDPETAQQTPVDCAKVELCQHPLCRCDASGCTVDLVGTTAFDLTRTNASLDGGVKDLPGCAICNVRLQRQP